MASFASRPLIYRWYQKCYRKKNLIKHLHIPWHSSFLQPYMMRKRGTGCQRPIWKEDIERNKSPPDGKQPPDPPTQPPSATATVSTRKLPWTYLTKSCSRDGSLMHVRREWIIGHSLGATVVHSACRSSVLPEGSCFKDDRRRESTNVRDVYFKTSSAVLAIRLSSLLFVVVDFAFPRNWCTLAALVYTLLINSTSELWVWFMRCKIVIMQQLQLVQ